MNMDSEFEKVTTACNHRLKRYAIRFSRKQQPDLQIPAVSQSPSSAPAPNAPAMVPSLTQTFLALELETRFALDTAHAAFHCNRRPQTLRSWACLENGPIRPIRVNGRLAWPVNEIRRMLGCSQD
jgi:hypothetical protein